MYELKTECLREGLFNQHLEQWLELFSHKQLFLIDSDLFRENPQEYLKSVQEFFNLKEIIDYKEKILYDSEKHYFCLKAKHSNKCMSSRYKRRKYREIDDNSLEFLNEFYFESNSKLAAILSKNGYPQPSWL